MNPSANSELKGDPKGKVAWPGPTPPMRRAISPSRFALACEYALGELPSGELPRVLDVGCVDARPDRESSKARVRDNEKHIFRHVADHNPHVHGIDLDPAGVSYLQSEGYSCEVANAIELDLEGRKFDVILATEIIEHVEDPGRFLRSIASHLAPGGKLVVTTPCPFYSAQIGKVWRKGRPDVHEEHVMWFDPITLARLVTRVGLHWNEGVWLAPRRRRLRNWRLAFRPYFHPAFGAVIEART
ncbi:MAG: 2-polyprenyl-3-methyl-5-hydroxy-6-metoxy-1,4-benzoquinol methylase [Planctomycetota bacterium]|jgi:2-polyprenyl-3-methyl-5-hydroxy-6-metoxy-1,4-benzoquinol methylase